MSDSLRNSSPEEGGIRPLFATLGFEAGTEEHLDELIAHVFRAVDPVPRADGGRTYIYGARSRAALAVQVDDAGSVEDVMAFLSPDTRQRCVYRGVSADPACPHRGVVLAECGESAGLLGFRTPHLVAWADSLEEGQDIEVGLAALVLHVPDGAAKTPASIEPSGHAGSSLSAAEITGSVEAHLLRHNEISRRPFEWARMEAGDVRLEVAADPATLARPFRRGDRLRMQAELVGVIW